MKRGSASPKDKEKVGVRPEGARKPRRAKGKVAAGLAEARNKMFPVVGVGASAGGLEAFTDLLKHLPERTGMAYVFIQHLAPKHESFLTEVLSKATQIRVSEVKDGMLVEPNHIYVTPPNANMSIVGARLNLAPRSDMPGQHMPIDHFLRSLATDRKNAAIGVILSGTASDGTQGIRAIKAEGGITFAQDDQSAKYSDMPRNAITTGAVDFILSPEGIAKQLTVIGRHPYLVQPEKRGELELKPEGTLEQILALLRKSSGVDFQSYRSGTIKRRIRRRMILHKLSRLDEYLRFLEKNKIEVKALYQDVLISVTSFFREPDAYEALKKRALQKLLRNRASDEPLRIWVPGCSTGEEAYSLAITLLEFLGEQASIIPVQLFATDVSDLALDKARSGVYLENISSEVSPGRLRRFFVQIEGGYQVSKPIRDMCIFARHDVTKDPPFSRLDLISCRNLLIYLQPALQKRILPIFHYALKPHGFLMLGSAETIGSFSDLFVHVDRKQRIYAKRPGAVRPAIIFGAGEFAPEKAAPANAAVKEAWNGFDVQRETERVLLNRYAPPGVLVNEEMQILQFRGRTGPYLEPSPGEATLHLMKMAREGLAFDLRSLIQKAAKQGQLVRREGVPLRFNGENREINLEVVPIKGPSDREHYFLVLFVEPGKAEAGPKEKQSKTKTAKMPSENQREVTRLRYEVETTKQYMQSLVEEQEATNEELRSANEEILSSNEELQSTNEEMETTREELQSTNEELTTLNEELQNRNVELGVVNNDLVNVLSNVAIAMVIVGSDLRIRRFTPAAEKTFNVIASDIGRPLSDLRVSLEAPDLEKWITECIDTVSSKECELQDREGRWYALRIRPYKTLENKIEGAVLSLIDIHAIKFNLDQLLGVLDRAIEGVFVRDLLDRITLWNQGAERIYGYTRKEALGKNPAQLLRTVYLTPFHEIRQHLVENDGHWDGDLMQTTKDGRTINVHSHWILQRDESGKPSGYVELNTDITESKRTVEALQASEKRYQSLFEGNLAGIFKVSLAGRVLDCNESFARYFGFASPEEVLTEKAWDAYFKPGEWKSFVEQLRDETTVTNLELDMRRKDGTPVSVIMNASLMGEGGEGSAIEGVVLDVTELRKRDASLRALSLRLFEVQDQERQRIARELHDTTAAQLAALSVSLSALEGSAGNLDPAARGALTQSINITRECAREVRTFSYLLHPPLMHDLGLVPALRWYVEGFAERSGVKVILDAPADLDHLPRPVEVAVFRLVQECLSNVHRHSGSKTANVRLAHQDKSLILEIKDEGRGIPHDFFVGSMKGAGLGLVGMQERVKVLGGRLDVKSGKKGTTITATLPLGGVDG